MNRLTIYERLKPEVKEALHSDENSKYKASVDSIVDALKSTTFYDDLKISDISRLYTFSGIDLIKVTAWDFKYGDNILTSKDYE